MKKFLWLVILVLLCSNIVFANIVDELTKLNNLYKEGAITKEEFNKAKEIIFKSETSENTTQPEKVEKKKENKQTSNKIKPKKVKKFDEDLTNTFISLDEIDEMGVYKKISTLNLTQNIIIHYR